MSGHVDWACCPIFYMLNCFLFAFYANYWGRCVWISQSDCEFLKFLLLVLLLFIYFLTLLFRVHINLRLLSSPIESNLLSLWKVPVYNASSLKLYSVWYSHSYPDLLFGWYCFVIYFWPFWIMSFKMCFLQIKWNVFLASSVWLTLS